MIMSKKELVQVITLFIAAIILVAGTMSVGRIIEKFLHLFISGDWWEGTVIGGFFMMVYVGAMWSWRK